MKRNGGPRAPARDEAARGTLPGRTGGIVAAAILAVALAYTEASLVVYLRALIAPVRARHFPDSANEPLPLLSPPQLTEAGESFPRLLVVEVTREITPVAALLAMAWGLARRRRQIVAFFLLGFGVWDIFYYVFLKILLDWPASLGTWDILYLIPTAWVAPVWAPLVVSVTLVLAGLAILRQGDRPYTSRGRLIAWPAVGVGTGLVLLSFFLRTREAFHRVPRRFDWPVFLIGWLLAGAGLVWLLRTDREHRQEVL